MLPSTQRFWYCEICQVAKNLNKVLPTEELTEVNSNLHDSYRQRTLFTSLFQMSQKTSNQPVRPILNMFWVFCESNKFHFFLFCHKWHVALRVANLVLGVKFFSDLTSGYPVGYGPLYHLRSWLSHTQTPKPLISNLIGILDGNLLMGFIMTHPFRVFGIKSWIWLCTLSFGISCQQFYFNLKKVFTFVCNRW